MHRHHVPLSPRSSTVAIGPQSPLITVTPLSLLLLSPLVLPPAVTTVTLLSLVNLQTPRLEDLILNFEGRNRFCQVRSSFAFIHSGHQSHTVPGHFSTLLKRLQLANLILILICHCTLHPILHTPPHKQLFLHHTGTRQARRLSHPVRHNTTKRKTKDKNLQKLSSEYNKCSRFRKLI